MREQKPSTEQPLPVTTRNRGNKYGPDIPATHRVISSGSPHGVCHTKPFQGEVLNRATRRKISARAASMQRQYGSLLKALRDLRLQTLIDLRLQRNDDNDVTDGNDNNAENDTE